MIVPESDAASISAKMCRAISTPLSSSPWTAPVRQSVGPGRAPRMIWTSTSTTPLMNDSWWTNESCVAVPGATGASLGLPENGKEGVLWGMDAGTSTAHLMIPGQ